MLRLHCFAQSGNCYKVALALRAMKLPFEMVFVDFMHGATRDPNWRAAVNTMGEVPVLEDGARRLTQSGVILTYLAKKTGLFGGADEDQQLEVLRWLFFDNHKFTSYFASLRFMKAFAATPPDPAVTAWLRSRLEGSWAIVEHQLGTQPYLAGAAPTVADFSLAGYLYYPEDESGWPVLPRYPAIGAWLERLRALDGWVAPYDLLPGEVIAPRW
jgi:glutathione S-transferase